MKWLTKLFRRKPTVDFDYEVIEERGSHVLVKCIPKKPPKEDFFHIPDNLWRGKPRK